MGDARDVTFTTTRTNKDEKEEDGSSTVICKLVQNEPSSSSLTNGAEYHGYNRYDVEHSDDGSNKSNENDIVEKEEEEGLGRNAMEPLDHQQQQEEINDSYDYTNNNNDDEEHHHHQPQLKFRKLKPSDRYQIQKLHEEWFPVQYEDKFYDCLVENRMMVNGDDDDGDGEEEEEEENNRGLPLYSCVATFEVEEEEEVVKEEEEEDVERGVLVELLEDEEEEEDEEDWRNSQTRRKREEIVGCIVGTFITKKSTSSSPTNSSLTEETCTLLLPPIQNNPLYPKNQQQQQQQQQPYTKMFYIMTLGTVRYYRNRGIASMLVEKAIRDVVEGDEACGVVYLHVITYNERAIGFYERLGFVRVKEIQDYYRINGENYNCYLYAKYFHGNRGHWTIMSYLSSIVSSVWKRFTNVVAPPPPPSSSGSTLKNNSNGNSNSNGNNGYI